MGIPPRELICEWSYENLLLLSRSTPSYDRDGDGKGHRRHEWDPKMDANDPSNFRTATDEEEFIR